jgi:hypothetical protein
LLAAILNQNAGFTVAVKPAEAMIIIVSDRNDKIGAVIGW